MKGSQLMDASHGDQRDAPQSKLQTQRSFTLGKSKGPLFLSAQLSETDNNQAACNYRSRPRALNSPRKCLHSDTQLVNVPLLGGSASKYTLKNTRAHCVSEECGYTGSHWILPNSGRIIPFLKVSQLSGYRMQMGTPLVSLQTHCHLLHFQ